MNDTVSPLMTEYLSYQDDVNTFEERWEEYIAEGVIDPVRSYTPEELIHKKLYTGEEIRRYAVATERTISLGLQIETQSPFAVAKKIYRAEKLSLWADMGIPAKNLNEWYTKYRAKYGKKALDRSRSWLDTLKRVYELYFEQILRKHPDLLSYVEQTNISVLDAMRGAVFHENAREWLPHLPNIDKEAAPRYRLRAEKISQDSKNTIKVTDISYQMVVDSFEKDPIIFEPGVYVKASRVPPALRGPAGKDQYLIADSVDVDEDGRGYWMHCRIVDQVGADQNKQEITTKQEEPKEN